MYVKHPYAAVSLSVHKMLLKTSRPYFSKALQKSVRGFGAVLSEHAHKVALFVNLKAKQKARPTTSKKGEFQRTPPHVGLESVIKVE